MPSRVDNTSNYVTSVNNDLITTIGTKQATLIEGTNISIVGSTISTTGGSTFTPTSANLIGVFNGTQFTNNTITSKIDILTTWKPTTTGVADSALQLASSRNIAGVGFNGTTSIAIPYFNLDFKPTVGNGLSITTGSATVSPNLTLNLSAGTGIAINTTVNPATIGVSGLTAALIPDLDVAKITSGTLPVGRGGTGGTTFTTGQLIVGNTTSALQGYTGLTWATVTNLLSATNLAVSGNVGVGTTEVVTNVLQVGAGGRLRISNGATDYTLLGTIDTDGATNTAIVLSGNTRSTNAGNIQYLTASGGSHIFYTSPTTTTRMTISSTGVNVNNDLGVTGNVGIGIAPATYKLNVSGDINATGAVRVGGTSVASKWTTNANGIHYGSGNVSIGGTLPTHKLEVSGYVKSSFVAFHSISNHGTYTYPANTRITGVASQGWDGIMVNITSSSWASSTGVFTAPLAGVYMVCCSAYLASNNHAFSIRRNATSSTTGQEYAGVWIGTGSGVVSTDRSYFSAQAVMQLLLADTISVWSGSSGCAISNGPANSISIYLIMPT